VTQIGQGSDDAIITPATVLTSQAHHQLLDCRLDSRAGGRPAILRAIEFLSDELPIPGEDRIRFGDASDFLKGFRPRHVAIPAKVALSPLDNRNRPWICDFKM
jgi:hypothetical protein